MRAGSGIVAAAALLAAGVARGDGPAMRWDPWAIPGARRHGAVAAPAAGSDPSGSACELSRADRTRTDSRSCIACHDGSAGPGVPFSMRPDGTGLSHPVEIDYSAAAARDPQHYEPFPPREIALVNGRIACTSCHDGAAPAPAHVALGEDRLCYGCHRL